MKIKGTILAGECLQTLKYEIMKKILTLFGFMLFNTAYSQCTINGSSQLSAGTTETYSVENDVAQCRDCHLWENSGSIASMQGNVKKGAVRLRGNSAGKMTLNLTMLSPQGVVQCSKNIEVVDGSGEGRISVQSTHPQTVTAILPIMLKKDSQKE